MHGIDRSTATFFKQLGHGGIAAAVGLGKHTAGLEANNKMRVFI